MTMRNIDRDRIGRRARIRGIVQGVGFRPFVYTVATRHGLAGWVLNDSAGVELEVYGPQAAVDAFLRALQAEAPPLAVIDAVEVTPVTPPASGDPASLSFEIRHSSRQPGAFVPISPDICTCDDCLRELLDPNDRRFRYPFINCTNCGPRFTIVRDVPYDRPLTTMAAFPLCPACQAEYDDPADRRFHAQPNACPVCGPRLAFRWSAHARPDLVEDAAIRRWEDDALRQVQAVLAQGGIVAIKGIGGFHLACSAVADEAVAELRRRKGRVDKPFAVMAPDVAAVAQFAAASDEERKLLTGKERPIVLLRKRRPCPLSEWVAPGNDTVGVMLPYTPLHTLLLAADARGAAPRLPALVMTSGNRAEEPIAFQDDEALERLAPLADAFLLHDRAIHVPCDDSVVRVFQGRELPVRRSRGYTPFPVRLPREMPTILAVGGELKNTFCLTRERYAFMSQHIGDMENLETLDAFACAVDHFRRLFRITPAAIACDKHPAYLSTRWARDLAAAEGIPLVEVQHHHAHIAAVMAEHGLDGAEPVIGISFDGTGYGDDGAIWGGEVLVASYAQFERVAHLRYVPLPGGDAAIRRPYRAALAHLWAARVEWDEVLPPVAACPPLERSVIRRQLETGFNAVPTSSMGRLFDAVAALAGGRQTVTYEAQAAMEFETVADLTTPGAYAFEIVAEPGKPWQLDGRPLIQAVADDVLAGVLAGVIAAKFHRAVARLAVDVCVRLQRERGLSVVGLSGGVFQNVTLLDLMVQDLEAEGFRVLAHRRVPPNDGGIALGQAVVAGLGDWLIG